MEQGKEEISRQIEILKRTIIQKESKEKIKKEQKRLNKLLKVYLKEK